ncbi:hypothetical protein [Streptomyces sp. NPDC017673]|uniref:YxiG-like protein n=1 Tax=unclassified Streptomyces TaxID=2593676 RepID=UPI0037BD6E4A
MDTAVLEQMLDEAFDHAVVHHGYTDYMRDYEVIVHTTADPRIGIAPLHLRYLFRHCVEAQWETSVLLPESEATRRWSKALGIDIHEVRIETNAHNLTLLFSDLQMSEVPVGHAPFVTE